MLQKCKLKKCPKFPHLTVAIPPPPPPLSHAYCLIRFQRNSVGNHFLVIFFPKFRMCFSRSNIIGHISGKVGPVDVKRKGSTSVEYWVNYVTLIFDLTHDLDLGFFKVKFWNSCISGIVIWLVWHEKKSSRYWADLYSLGLWPHPWPWHWSFKVNVWNSLISGMGGRKGCESIIHDHGRDPLQWRHDGHGSVANHQPHDCLLNRLFRRRSKKTSKLRVTGLCAENSLGTGEFPAQMASNAENVSIWWRHHASACCRHI